jgi:hypothetical protein
MAAAFDPQAHIAKLERELQWASLTIQKRDAQIRLLEERLRQQRMQVLGPHSETLSDYHGLFMDPTQGSLQCRIGRVDPAWRCKYALAKAKIELFSDKPLKVQRDSRKRSRSPLASEGPTK